MCRYPLGSGGKRVTTRCRLPDARSASTRSRMKLVEGSVLPVFSLAPLSLDMLGLLLGPRNLRQGPRLRDLYRTADRGRAARAQPAPATAVVLTVTLACTVTVIEVEACTVASSS